MGNCKSSLKYLFVFSPDIENKGTYYRPLFIFVIKIIVFVVFRSVATFSCDRSFVKYMGLVMMTPYVRINRSHTSCNKNKRNNHTINALNAE